MRFFFGIAALLQFVGICYSYAIEAGTLKVGNNEVSFGEFNAAVINPLSLSSGETIDVSVQLKSFSKIPHQAFISLSNSNNLEKQYFAIIKESGSVKLSIPIRKIPASLLSSDSISIQLIVADFDQSEQPLIIKIGDILPAQELAAEYEPALRLAAKPEIHHIFRTSEKTVNPVISVVFVLGAILLFSVLLGAWVFDGGANFNNAPSDSSAIYHVVFIASIAAYELIFLRYYLGTSIFDTIYAAALCAGPIIFSGSRVFRYLLSLRNAGRV